MALYLDAFERKYLKELLNKYPSTWWPHKKILDKIKVDEERLDKIKNCKHEYGKYEGKKECCVFCCMIQSTDA